MPLSTAANISSASAGLFIESDRLALSAEFRLEGTHLRDTTTQIEQILHPQAVPLIRALQMGISAPAWISRLRHADIAEDDIRGFIAFLNGLGAIVIKRAPRQWLTHRLNQTTLLILYRQPITSRVRRYPASLIGLMQAESRAMISLGLLAILVAGLWIAVGVNARSMLLAVILGLVLIWLSTLAHEYAHLVFIRRHTPVIILQKNIRLGVTHRRLNVSEERIAALVGPAIGILFSLVLGAFAAALTHMPALLWLGGLIALMHAYSLSPSYGDGRALWRAQTGESIY